MSDTYRKYLIDYYHHGAWWNFTIFASSFDDAAERVTQIRLCARLAGMVEAEVPAGYGPLVRAACWIRRLFYPAGCAVTAPPIVKCSDCGAPYGSDGWCDVVVPNDIWNQIMPEGGVLCFRCMTKRIQAHGLDQVPVIVASGPYVDANETWRMIGWEHGHKVGLAETGSALAPYKDQTEPPMKMNSDPNWLRRMAAEEDKQSINVGGEPPCPTCKGARGDDMDDTDARDCGDK